MYNNQVRPGKALSQLVVTAVNWSSLCPGMCPVRLEGSPHAYRGLLNGSSKRQQPPAFRSSG
jgi:hypothetical protein